MSLYSDLGVSPDAPPEAIKAAHRSGVKRHHPDAGGEQAAFDKLQRAFAVLRDPLRRDHYDRTGEYDEAPDPGEQNALKLVQEMMAVVIGRGEDMTRLNLVSACLGMLSARLQAVAAESGKADAALARIAQAQERLELIAPVGDDPLHGLLQQQVRELKKRKIAVQRSVQAHGRAIQLLHGYTYRVDEEPAEAASVDPAP